MRHLRAGQHLVGTAGVEPFRVGVYQFTDLSGRRIATFPMNAMGVQPSQHAPVPLPGQTTGELFFSGTAEMGSTLGTIVAAQGNMGQVFLFTEDGLLVSSLFRDGRANPPGWPDRFVKGDDFTESSMLQEPFGGWFGKQDDGKVRVLFGRTEAIVCEVKGLEKVQRLAAGSISLVAPVGAGIAIPKGAKNAASVVIARIPKEGPKAITIDGKLAEWKEIRQHKITAGEAELGTVQLAHDGTHLYLAYQVVDASPLLNKAQDERAHFKEGDCGEFTIGPMRAKRDGPIAGDLRVLLVPTKPTATTVLYRALVPGTQEKDRVKFTSPVGTTVFDSVAKMADVRLEFQEVKGGYVCEARIPFKSLGIEPKAGAVFLADLGILFSDKGGQTTTSRAYLFNKTHTIVADVHEEARLLPATWGVFELE
jgi:hypothetical protein